MKIAIKTWLFPRYRTLVLTSLSILSLGIVLACYWVGLSGPFILDDLQSIEPTKMSRFSLTEFLSLSLQNHTGPMGRPLTIATFVLNNYFFSMDPYYFKLVNLFIHLLCTIAVAVLISLIVLLLPGHRKNALMAGFFTALLFALHPLQVSTVLYSVQRMTQLSALFILLGLNTYLWGRLRLQCQLRYAWVLMASSVILFFPLAALSKETGLLFPWYLFAIEYFILQFKTIKPQDEYFLTHFHRLFSLTALLAGLFYYWHKLSFFTGIFIEKNQILSDRIFTQIKALAFYIRLILLPSLSRMSLYHDDFRISYYLDNDVLLAALLLASIVFTVFWCRKKAPILAFGLSWFLISHMIESTILPLEMVFEHRNYLAIVGLLLILVFYSLSYIQKASPHFKKFALGAASIFLLFNITLTCLRAQTWSSSESILADGIQNHPSSARVRIETANWFLNQQNYLMALYQLELAQTLEIRNAGIALHELLVFCRMPEIPPELYTNALTKVKVGIINPYTIVVLDTMVQNMFNKQCNAMDKDKLLEIIDTAINNTHLQRNPRYQAILYHLAAGIEVLKNNQTNSRSLLLKSFNVYPQRLDPLIQKVNIEIQSNLLKDAKETLTIIHQHANMLNSSQEVIHHIDENLRLKLENPPQQRME